MLNILRNKKIQEKHLVWVFFGFWLLIFVVLSLFRNAQSDENIYLGESAVIADLLKNGQWIGNYGVGLHGFLSKLVVGIIFIFTGPSVFVATLFNIILGIFSGVTFYRILRKNMNLDVLYSFLGTLLLFCSYQFITYIPSFYRDIGVLLFLLLTIESILSKKSKWITGIFLLFVLDSKEHVFFTLAPTFLIWIAIESWQKNKAQGNKVFEGIKDFIVSGVKLFFPSLIFLLLMFTTSIIPLNIYNANILGLIDEGLKPLTINFDPQYSTINRDLATNPDIAKVAPTLGHSENSSGIIKIALGVFNIGLSYIGKIGYPRTFSFLSVPFLIVIPALASSVVYFRLWIKKRQIEKLIIPIALFVYLSIYIFHASISRYILPISPLLFICFMLFLKDISKSFSVFRKIFIATVFFVSLGLIFEYSYIWVKIGFSLIILILFFLFNKMDLRRKKILMCLIVLLISTFTAGSSIFASYKVGQVGSSVLYGYDRECEQIMNFVKNEDVIWVNDIGWDKLPYALRSENIQNPEWRWGLKEWIPKKKMLIFEQDLKTYSLRWRKESEIISVVDERSINKFMYIQLNKNFQYDDLFLQGRIKQISSFNWLKLIEKIEMKNKTVYVFEVNLDRE